MAYYELEPFGEHISDLRHGVATATLANINRNRDLHPEPFRADDFISWRAVGLPEGDDPVLLDDPVAQSNLIRAAIFGKLPDAKS